MASNSLLTERGMVRRAIPGLYPALDICRDHYHVAKELTIGKNIADVIFFRSDDDAVWPEAPLSAAESVILSIVRLRTSARLNTIARHAFLSIDEVEDAVMGRLAEWDLVRIGDRGMVEATRAWADQSEVITIEAKLTKWRDALSQAISYRHYSDRSYVLLPHFCVGAAVRNLHEFKIAGVGLLSYSPNEVEKILEAKPSRLHLWQREYALSRLTQPRGRRTTRVRRTDRSHPTSPVRRAGG
ncbi:MAG: hypothetical protein R3B57_14770 [Phycisphaerales bacterium]